VGDAVWVHVGTTTGATDGATDGTSEGALLGETDGAVLGAIVVAAVGCTGGGGKDEKEEEKAWLEERDRDKEAGSDEALNEEVEAEKEKTIVETGKTLKGNDAAIQNINMSIK
jgi:hypothetical protein